MKTGDRFKNNGEEYIVTDIRDGNSRDLTLLAVNVRTGEALNDEGRSKAAAEAAEADH